MQKTVKTPEVQFVDKVADVRTDLQRDARHLSEHAENSRVPRVQFIDNLEGDPTVMQRHMSTIQRAQHPDVAAFMLDTDDPCNSAVGQDDSDKLNEELARENMKRKADKKAANGSDRERFKDMVLPPSQPCFNAGECSIASSDERRDEVGDGSTEGGSR